MAFVWFALCVCISQVASLAYEPTIDEIIESSLPDNATQSLFIDNGRTVRIEMDMLFRSEDYLQFMEEADLPDHQRVKRKAIRNTRLRWSNKQVVYSIRSGLFSSTDVKKIKAGISEWEKYTCLTFKQRTNERNYIDVRTGAGCSSFVGMIGGAQRLSLERGCRYHKTIVHEFGHAIGFHHEQCRSDRDQYVTINTGNIQSGKSRNFNKYSTSTVNNHGVSYDYGSVMHYGANAFSKNGRATITTKDTSKQRVIGRAPGLSFRDIKLANAMYTCADNCASKSCPGEGFVGKDCICYCPSGDSRNPLKKCDNSGPGPTNVPPTASPPTASPPSGCTNNNERCQEWADRGECSIKIIYMMQNCKKACDSCAGGANCKNDNDSCENWAARGECSANPGYMKSICRKACAQC